MNLKNKFSQLVSLFDFEEVFQEMFVVDVAASFDEKNI